MTSYHATNTLIFLQKWLYFPNLSQKKFSSLHPKSFSKHPLFTTFPLFFTVTEVCNISNKCKLLNKSATKIFLHKTPDTVPLWHQKICALHCKIFEKHPLFATFLLVFTVDELCYISNKYQSPNNLRKYQYFYTGDFISLLHFEK